MTEIEKATFAVWLTQHLVNQDKKILCVAAIRKLYACEISEAKKFVEEVEIKKVDIEFVKNLCKKTDTTQLDEVLENTRFVFSDGKYTPEEVGDYVREFIRAKQETP